MNEIPSKDKEKVTIPTKSIVVILTLIIIGCIAGFIVSNQFINSTNERIENFKDMYNPNAQLLTGWDVVIPTIGVMIVFVSIFLLIGLIIVYFKVFIKTRSRYVFALLLFLIPMLLKSFYLIGALRELYMSPIIPFPPMRESVGFGFGGFGGMIVIVSFFEIIALTILLHLSME